MPTSEQVISEQKRRAAKDQARNSSQAPLSSPPDPPASTAVAIPDGRSFRAAYLDVVSPQTMPGIPIKFSKSGQFVPLDAPDEPLPPDETYIAHCNEVLIGWIKFAKDAPPERRMGRLYDDNYVMESRESLGDDDPSLWEDGLDGKPADPWLHQQALVLENTKSKQLYTFLTTSTTGRNSVGRLLRHYERLTRMKPGAQPIVKLGTSGFQHKQKNIGFVVTPDFKIVGDTAPPAAGSGDHSPASDMNDELPF